MTRFELDLLYVLGDLEFEMTDDIIDIGVILGMRDNGYFQNINDDMTLGEAITVYTKLLEKDEEVK